MPYNFAPASPDDAIVYGACRPCHPRTPTGSSVADWLGFMQHHGIQRVCCVLDTEELNGYDDLLDHYAGVFGADNVLHVPVQDFSIVDDHVFCERILPFLREADELGDPVVVHCSAGMGRTGHILALWLVHGKEYKLDDAIATVSQSDRTPLEAGTRHDLAAITCPD